MELDKSVDAHSHSIAVPGPTVLFVSLLLSPGPNRLNKLLKKDFPGQGEAFFPVFHFFSIGYHISGVADSVLMLVRLNEAICLKFLFHLLSCLHFLTRLGMVHAPKDPQGASIPLHVSLDCGYALGRGLTRIP